eukprot:1033252-Alexandrium_andersonii.AAC.1
MTHVLGCQGCNDLGRTQLLLRITVWRNRCSTTQRGGAQRGGVCTCWATTERAQDVGARHQSRSKHFGMLVALDTDSH